MTPDPTATRPRAGGLPPRRPTRDRRPRTGRVTTRGAAASAKSAAAPLLPQPGCFCSTRSIDRSLARRIGLPVLLLAVALFFPTPAPAQPWGVWLPAPGSFGDWRWAPPVVDVASLPAGSPDGEARLVLSGPEAGLHCRLDGAWEDCGGGDVITDHGALTGLLDDDHPQYATDTDLTTHAGDPSAHHSPTVDTDDQAAAEVPYTPAQPADWTDPDPTQAAAGLDQLASRLFLQEGHGHTLAGDVTGDLASTVVGDDSHAHGDTTIDGLDASALTTGTVATARLGSGTADATTFLRGDQTWGTTGGSGFDTLTSGTNTTAAMVIGTGASLKPSGSGTVDASGIDADGDGSQELASDGSDISIPVGDLHIGPSPTGFEAYELTVNSDRGGIILNRTGNNSSFILLMANNSSSNGGQVRAAIGGGLGFHSGPGAEWARINSTELYTSGTISIRSGGNVAVGGRHVNSPSTTACADSSDANPGFVVITPTTSTVRVTQQDPDGCGASLSETGASDGQQLRVLLTSTAGGTLDFSDSSGVQETGAGCSLSLWGAATFEYVGDRWVLAACQATN